MVFGNNLIDFSANDMAAGTVTWPLPPSPLLSTIGQYPSPPPSNSPPKKILPLEISKTYTGLTFTLKLDGSNYMGCGPQDSNGDEYTNGAACISYPTTMSKQEIESKLLAFLKKLREQEKEQEAYNKAKAQWEQDKAGCEAEVKEGSTFSFVNEDKNSTPYGPPTDKWICMESISATEPESEPESETEDETPVEEDEEETTSGGGIMAQSTATQPAPSNLSIGFSQELGQTLKTGGLVGAVLLVGYGAYKFEDRTKVFSKMFKGKKQTSKTDTTPKTTKANKTV